MPNPFVSGLGLGRFAGYAMIIAGAGIWVIRIVTMAKLKNEVLCS